MIQLLTLKYFLKLLHQLEHIQNHEKNKLHGHSFELCVTLQTDAQSPAPRGEVDDIVESTILKPFNNVNMNDHLSPSSGEKIVELFFQKLLVTPIGVKLQSVELKETEKNSFLCSKVPISKIAQNEKSIDFSMG